MKSFEEKIYPNARKKPKDINDYYTYCYEDIYPSYDSLYLKKTKFDNDNYFTSLNNDDPDCDLEEPRFPKTPSKLRTVKIPLDNIIMRKDDLKIIFDAVNRTNQIVIHVYMFIRLYLLDKYNGGKQIPNIDRDFMAAAIRTISAVKKAGPPVKGENLKLTNKLKEFYDSTYKHLGYKNKIDGTNLSHILDTVETDIITNIENNIKLNFFKYVKQFVNVFFKSKFKDMIEKADKKDKVDLKKVLDKDLSEIKQDLINNTSISNPKYHKWIKKHRSNVFPNEYKNSYEFDIIHYPQKYLKNMIYMCIEIEKKGGKSFQFFPMRSEAVPKYIPIDTGALIDLFIEKDKNEFNNNISKYKDPLWDNFFQTCNPIFNQKQYTFDHRILTDGFTVSIQMINRDMIDDVQQEKDNRKIARQNAKKENKNLTQKEIDKRRKQKAQDKKDKLMKIKLEEKMEKDRKKLEYNNLSKDEQKKIRERLAKEEEIKKIMRYIEFPYLEELNESEYLNLMVKDHWVVCDPGKRFLVYMKSKDGRYLRYSNAQHLRKTKRIKYRILIQNYKNKNDITEIEKELTNYNSKSCIYETFKSYVKKKNAINKKLLPKYEAKIFRQYKWYGFLNRKRAETDLIRKIKKTFGKKNGQAPTIIYGDWSIGQQMKHMISTPNLSLKHKIGEHFKVYSIDEHRTSCLSSKSEEGQIEKTVNLYLPDPKNKEVVRKMHSILTYKMSNKRIGCINRDKNAVNNMITITTQFLKDRSRPERFKRSVKLDDLINNKKERDQEFIPKESIKLY